MQCNLYTDNVISNPKPMLKKEKVYRAFKKHGIKSKVARDLKVSRQYVQQVIKAYEQQTMR